MPCDHVMLGVDCPFSDNSMGKDYLHRIQDEKVLDDGKLAAFAHGNAVKLLFRGRSAGEIVGHARV